MVEGNHAETAGPTSIAHQHQQQHQAMTSVPPPTGNHPRYDRPGGGPSMGYGGGPPPPHGSYGNAFSSYPPPYGNSMHGNYGGGPPPQGPPPGYPRGPYPHYGSGYGPGAGPGGYSPPGHPPPPYPYGGYEGHYGQPPPGHLPHPSGSYRGASPVPPPSSSAAATPAVPSGSPSPSTEPNSSPNKGNDTTTPGIKQEPGAKLPGSSSQQQQQHSQSSPPSESRPSPTASDHGEVERLRAAAATEITTEEVKPIQTDFHFFVKEHVEEFRKLAQDEVRKSLQTDGGENISEEEQLDPMLVNSNLNSRFMRAWESLTKKHRDSYMVQEEADRRRFMEDDEIASRHCATLTARGKSQTAIVTGSIVTATPQQQLKPQEKKETQPGDDKVPPPKTVEAKTENDGEEKKAEEPSKDDDAVKRPVPESSTSSGISDGTKSEVHESPTKKNKVAL